jgi:hypothetical protein
MGGHDKSGLELKKDKSRQDKICGLEMLSSDLNRKGKRKERIRPDWKRLRSDKKRSDLL